MAFGDIEVITHRLWREHCQGKAPNFKPRVTQLLEALKTVETNNSDLISCLESALELVEKRNTIAHNPAQVQVFQHGRTGELLIELGISSETSDDYIDDCELKELTASAEEIVTRMYMLLGLLKR